MASGDGCGMANGRDPAGSPWHWLKWWRRQWLWYEPMVETRQDHRGIALAKLVVATKVVGWPVVETRRDHRGIG